MIRGFFIFFLNFFFAPYFLGAQNAAFSSGKWAKIALSKQGIYQITGAQLKALGFNLPINASQLQLFNYNLNQLSEKVSATISTNMTENAIQVFDGGDNQIDEKDYILFYAEGVNQWKYNLQSNLPTHFKNTTNDSVFYFLTIGMNGKRINSKEKIITSGKIVDQYDERWLIENDSISLLNSGKLLLGPPMGQGLGKQNKLSYPINLNGLVLTNPMNIVGRYVATTYQNAASFLFSINDNAIKSSSVAPVSGYLYDETANIAIDSFSYSINTNNTNTATVNISFQANDAAATGWIDFIELSAKRKLGFWSSNTASFRTLLSAVKGSVLQYQIQNADANTIVWDVTNVSTPYIIPTDNSNGLMSFNYVSDTLNEFFALKQQAYETPTLIGPMNNQNIAGMNVPDYLIISASNYINASKKLQSFHIAAHGLKTEVVNVNDIFNEFSGGQASPIGIRNFLKYIMNKALINKQVPPRYLLLMGMANFNPKNYNGNIQVPVYESAGSTGLLTSYPTDDFYSILNDKDDINIYANIKNLSLAVGRLPIRSVAEADSVVDKIINYQKNTNGGSWKNKITWVADDGDYNLHLQDAEEISTHLQEKAPAYNQKKIYLDFYPVTKNIAGNTYPAVNSDIIQTVNEGTLVLNYTGHGNYSRLTEEAVISQTEVQQWKNASSLPLMITASCDFAPYDQPQLNPFGFDALMKNSNGVIAIVAASRLVFAYSNKQINDHFIQALLVPDSAGHFFTIGEALQKAKIQAWNLGEDHVNAFKFTLLGDPAMHLAAPNVNLNVLSINKKVFTQKDTLQAGNKYNIAGSVQVNGKIKNDFDGWVDFVLLDAVNYKKTLANAGTSIAVSVPTQEKVLFKGKATVNKGLFSIDFLLPKEVTLLKSLKMQLSAYSNTADAITVYDKLIAIDALGNLVNDMQGPKVKMYLNDSNFKDSGWASLPSKLIVELEDSSGIQTSGNALGHDIVLVIDDDTKNTYFLNNYFIANIDSYQKGLLQYSLPNLSEGFHKLEFKVWDLLGNSTTQVLHFEIPKDGAFNVKNLYNYPNPFNSHTQFSFEISKFGSPIEIFLNIYNNNGDLILTKPLSASFQANRVLADWDGNYPGTQFLPPGLYYYCLIIKEGDRTQKLNNKLIKF